MRKLLIGLTVLLTACASTSSVKTFDQIYADALTANDVVVQATTTALNAGLITSVQAASVQKITIDASNLLTAAQTAFTAGDSIAANSDVVAATATLAALSLCLTHKPLTVATFGTCAAAIPSLVPPP